MTAATICYRLPEAAEMLFWCSPAEATEAAQIVPCADVCRGDHVVLYVEEGRIRVMPAHAQEKIEIA